MQCLRPFLLTYSLLVSLRQGRRCQTGCSPWQKTLTVCAVPSAMPRTGKAPDGTPRGLDVAVAQAVVRGLGRAVEFHWCASAECSWHCLPERRCDVVVGQPQDSGPREVAWSVPYAGAQFGLVVPASSQQVRSLADLGGKRVGIVTGTVALSEKDHAVVRFKTREELLERIRGRVARRRVPGRRLRGLVPARAPQLARTLRLVNEYVLRERWNMALAVRASDSQLLVEINRTLAQLAETGELRKIYAEHGVPLRPPFTASAARPARLDRWQRIRTRGELVVSMDPANLPYSSAKEDRPGFDVELARALAEKLQVKLRIDWLDVQRDTAVGQLLAHQCDLVMGQAVAANIVADEEELAGKVLYSRPYYGTGYVLVRRKDGPLLRSLAELKGARSQRLGAEAGSVADYSLRQRGYERRLFRNQLATLKALNDGDIDAAYLWANVGWTLHASPDFKLEIVPEYVPEDHWNIAIAMCAGDDELKSHVDAALATLISDGTVVQRPGAVTTCLITPPSRRKPVMPRGAPGNPFIMEAAKRGPEPRMQKVATSKHPYSGLSRVRSAGELVVGLDQNNLPFSTAHPRPEGLDVEIAGLLAEQLGVKLRVYWAYSCARFLSLETGSQTALRRHSGCDARRSLRRSGSSTPGPIISPGTCSSRALEKAVPRWRSLWLWKRASRCAGSPGRRLDLIPAPKPCSKLLPREESRLAT